MREVRWVASSKKDLLEFPEDARREALFALEDARLGLKHASAKPLKGQRYGDRLRRRRRCIPRRLYSPIRGRCLCAPCISEEIDARTGNAQASH